MQGYTYTNTQIYLKIHEYTCMSKHICKLRNKYREEDGQIYCMFAFMHTYRHRDTVRERKMRERRGSHRIMEGGRERENYNQLCSISSP